MSVAAAAAFLGDAAAPHFNGGRVVVKDGFETRPYDGTGRIAMRPYKTRPRA